MSEEFRLRPNLAWRMVGDEVVVFDDASSKYVTVSGAGAVLWQRLADPASRDQLVSTLLETYDVDDQTAHDDVAAFLTTLSEQGLLAR